MVCHLPLTNDNNTSKFFLKHNRHNTRRAYKFADAGLKPTAKATIDHMTTIHHSYGCFSHRPRHTKAHGSTLVELIIQPQNQCSITSSKLAFDPMSRKYCIKWASNRERRRLAHYYLKSAEQIVRLHFVKPNTKRTQRISYHWIPPIYLPNTPEDPQDPTWLKLSPTRVKRIRELNQKGIDIFRPQWMTPRFNIHPAGTCIEGILKTHDIANVIESYLGLTEACEFMCCAPTIFARTITHKRGNPYITPDHLTTTQNILFQDQFHAHIKYLYVARAHGRALLIAVLLSQHGQCHNTQKCLHAITTCCHIS